VQPGLDGSDIRLNPIASSYRGVKLEKDGRTGTVFTENSHRSGQRGKCFG
jgi:hypothetical protein